LNTENLSTLKIHKLSQEQYERELEAGRIDESAIYLTPGEDYAAIVHSHSASSILTGTFAGQVAANANGQTPSTSLLRNSSLVSADTNPTVNGEICWTYK
jgi:hypothetical protein